MASAAATIREPAASSGNARSNPCALRAIPNEDVFFYLKTIDNSRLVREAAARPAKEYSAIAGAGVVAALLLCLLAPSVASILAGYKLEALKHEQQQLLDERTVLELAEARLLSPERLERLARRQNLTSPAPGQVVHLNPAEPAAVAALLGPGAE
jgi:hypothetical protein